MSWLDYLHNRGVTDEQIERYFITYSIPGFCHILEGRIIFPIIDPITGDIQTELGRSIDGTEPKFMIPPGYSKPTTLWPLYLKSVREAVAKKNYCFLVESVFDVMTLERHGYTALSFLGPMMNKDQVLEMIRYVRNPIILYHMDMAGHRGAFASVRIAESMGLFNISVYTSVSHGHDYSDIDEFLRERPDEAVRYLEEVIGEEREI